MTLFELSVMEGVESSPSIMVGEVSSIPVFVEEQIPMEDDDEEEGRVRLGFQQKNGK